MIGALVYHDYLKLIKKNNIIFNKISNKQIQPSSIDLTLSSECYQICHSFLCPKNVVRNKLENLIIKKINLKKEFLLEKHKTYLVRINEKLNLNNKIFGHCNPKSSTGRLDIFCRIIVDYCDEYEKIPINYKGELFLEITTRSFNIIIKKGDSLNQLRLVYNNSEYLTDNDLININNKRKLIFNSNMKLSDTFDNGLKITVDLINEKKIVAFRAKKTSKPLVFSKINYYKIEDYWSQIKFNRNNLTINKNNFYILKSKEKIRIPNDLAGEMIPYDTGIGDFRAHYAGFFDPGFGDPSGSYAVLEVKTNEIPFILEDGQTIARIKYEKLNKTSNVVYGTQIKSNYQNQGLSLSKNFKKNE